MTAVELPPRDGRSWIQTFTGRQVWPLNPKPEDICIEDIAHALALQCRYTGHVKQHYSVAQHSIIASWNHPNAPMWALMHDAAEAYLADVARPVKPYLIGYNQFEERLLEVIAERFQLRWPMPEDIKEIDIVMLATERRDLMAEPPIPWESTKGVAPLPHRIQWWGWALAEKEFLQRFYDLGGL